MTTIITGKGVGQIIFGMSKDNLISILGKSTETEIQEYPDGDRVIEFIYYRK